MGGGLPGGGVAGQRAEFQQRAGGGGAVQVPVGDDGAVVGAAGAAVGAGAGPGPAGRRLRAAGWPRLRRRGGRSRSRPGCRRAGCRPRACAVSTGTRARAGSWWQEQTVIRRASSGDGRAVLVAHHGGGRGVVAEEQLAVLAGAAAGAVPPGGLGVGAVAGAAGRGPGEGFHVGPVHRQRRAGVLELIGDAASSRSSQIAARVCEGRPSGDVLGQRVRDQAEGALGLPVGEQVRAGLPVRESRRAAPGRPRAGWSVRGGPGSGGRAGDRPGHSSMPGSRVRTSSCRARTPMGSSASIRGAMPERVDDLLQDRQRDAHRRAAPSSRTASCLPGGFQAGEQVAEPLGAGDPGGVHERGQAEQLARSPPARSRAAGRCPAGAARPRRPATGSAGW